MTLAEKLRFLADRVENKQEFYIMYGKNKILTDYEEFTESYDIQELEGIALSLKPQWEFTEDEKAILRNLPDDYRWIARNESDKLYFYTIKPNRARGRWTYGVGDVINLEPFNHLFQSVQWSDDEPCEFRGIYE